MTIEQLFSAFGLSGKYAVASAICAPLIAYLCYLLSILMYNIYWHPLSKFPGPILWAATPIPYVWYQITGRLPFIYERLHDKYGDVVRVLPHKLSFRHPNAWKDIYQNKSGHKAMPKDARSLAPGDEGVYNIITASNPSDHFRYSHKLHHALSSKALFDQEPFITTYVDLLIFRLKARCTKGPQDIVKWANLIYFDIISDLTFGESLNGLENEEYHPWLRGLFGSNMKSITFQRAMRQFPHIFKFLNLFAPKGLAEQQIKHSKFVREMVHRRMQDESGRPDFMSYILPYSEEHSLMTMPEVRATYGALMLAGSENVATTLVFTIFYLLKHPAALQKLSLEIRSRLLTLEDIDFLGVNSLKYLSAVINESMRLAPAAPTSQPRVVTNGGAIVAGYWVPGGTVVGAPPYCTNRHSGYFKDPNSFIPERWLKNTGYESDKKSAFHPFQTGPRACAGQLLALTEVRIVLARILWEFEISFRDADGGKWSDDLEIFHLWQMKPLYINLTAVERIEEKEKRSK
ncbi:Cytochrome P450 [Glarea lozoyensis ATCC 20868]|uniref:Cytochrome P450 n=1 Tax=Glarea lozoyensis (strain ATCC 20868 / MF5171) TaxID=1116229 RepID=S3CKD6_GLAL2|nr:Cytochrome P450 [Glarea lozoyensis ATCC 20868]EPE26987.1 Cytochrome P450 [Glarea lozoyensis ATCC 20868]